MLNLLWKIFQFTSLAPSPWHYNNKTRVKAFSIAFLLSTVARAASFGAFDLYDDLQLHLSFFAFLRPQRKVEPLRAIGSRYSNNSKKLMATKKKKKNSATRKIAFYIGCKNKLWKNVKIQFNLFHRRRSIVSCRSFSISN